MSERIYHRRKGVTHKPRHRRDRKKEGRPLGFSPSEKTREKTRRTILAKGEEYFKERGKKMWDTRRKNLEELKKSLHDDIL